MCGLEQANLPSRIILEFEIRYKREVDRKSFYATRHLLVGKDMNGSAFPVIWDMESTPNMLVKELRDKIFSGSAHHKRNPVTNTFKRDLLNNTAGGQ